MRFSGFLLLMIFRCVWLLYIGMVSGLGVVGYFRFLWLLLLWCCIYVFDIV